MSDQQTMPGAATTEQHALMKPFEGKFRANVKLWMGPGDPMESTGVMVNTLDLGGRFLHQHYTGDANDGPFPSFAGRGYWGYNTVDERWEGFWIDSASTIQQIEHGAYDAKKRTWTMEGEMTNPGTGEPVKKRSVISLTDDHRHTMEMYFATPKGESKGMEIQYIRA